MAWPAFDTHKAVKELCGAGFDDAQAEAVVEQINNAYSENVATKADVERLVTKEEFREALEKLATKEELREAVANLATKEEITRLATKEEITKLATKEELREAVAKLATMDDLEKLELRMTVQLEKQATVYLRYLVAVAVGIVAVSKALDLLLVG